GDLRGDVGVLDLGVAGERPEAQSIAFLLDVGGPRNEIQVHQMRGIGEAQLHQRDKALASREQLGLRSKLGDQRAGLFERCRAVVVERAWVHGSAEGRESILLLDNKEKKISLARAATVSYILAGLNQ